MMVYRLITKFGTVDGKWDYMQIASHNLLDPLKTMKSIMKVVPQCENDKLIIVKEVYDKRLKCKIGKTICY